MHRWLVVAGAALVCGCQTNTGVRTTPTYVEARLMPPLAVAPPATAATPRYRGATAVQRAMQNVTIEPTDLEMQGNTWVVADVDPRAIYRIPTAPLAPTTILLPEGEGLTSAVAGATEDFTMATATTGARAAVTVMPTCANPTSKRFGYDSMSPLVTCMSGEGRATLVTTGGIYHLVFPVYDWTALAQVELNHAPPPPTNPGAPDRPPFPNGRADPLLVQKEGRWQAPWVPVAAWADQDKMVVKFPKPLPELPGLYAGLEGEQIVNYRTLETADAIYLVTDRRVTEAELRLDDQVVAITSGAASTLSRGPI